MCGREARTTTQYTQTAAVVRMTRLVHTHAVPAPRLACSRIPSAAIIACGMPMHICTTLFTQKATSDMPIDPSFAHDCTTNGPTGGVGRGEVDWAGAAHRPHPAVLNLCMPLEQSDDG